MAEDSASQTRLRTCAFCGARFRPRTRGGSPQRFHDQSCRHAHSALARRLGLLAVQSGLIAPKAIQASGLAVPEGSPTGVTPRFRRTIQPRFRDEF
jgi:hypothetical protein